MIPNNEELKKLSKKTSTIYLNELLTKRLHSYSDEENKNDLEFEGDYILKR